MYRILPNMRRKLRPSMYDQIIRTDLLSGILVVETGGKRVQNMDIMKIIIIIIVINIIIRIRNENVPLYLE